MGILLRAVIQQLSHPQLGVGKKQSLEEGCADSHCLPALLSHPCMESTHEQRHSGPGPQAGFVTAAPFLTATPCQL